MEKVGYQAHPLRHLLDQIKANLISIREWPIPKIKTLN